MSLSLFINGIANFWEKPKVARDGVGGEAVWPFILMWIACGLGNEMISLLWKKPYMPGYSIVLVWKAGGAEQVTCCRWPRTLLSPSAKRNTEWGAIAKCLMGKGVRLVRSVLLRGVRARQSCLPSTPAIRSTRKPGRVAELPSPWATDWAVAVAATDILSS